MDPVRVGIAGLGIATRQVLVGFDVVDGVALTAVADVRGDELERFAAVYPGIHTFHDVRALCECPDVDVVWIATPNHLHAEHAVHAAAHGKHIICEKPMATTMADADRMVDAVEAAGVRYVQGHSKIYRSPVRVMRQIVASGELGRPLQIHTLMYNDWLRRPVTADEVDEVKGGGVVFRQAPHQMDIVRFLGGGQVRSVRAVAGRGWAPRYDIEGHYSALLEFDDDCVAVCGFNGYGHFDVAELTWGLGEGGQVHSDKELYGIRPPANGAIDAAEKYDLPQYSVDALREARTRTQPAQDFFGVTIVNCERGDLRQSPNGVYRYTQQGRTEIPAPQEDVRAGELRELVACLREDREPFPGARWARASLECVVGILESARSHREVPLRRQVAAPAHVPLIGVARAEATEVSGRG